MTKLKLFLYASAAVLPAVAHAQSDDDRIVVVASGVEQDAETTGRSITVLDRDLIEARQTVSLSDLLATTPGVSSTRNGGPGGVTAVRIRGAEDAQTLVLIDGVRVMELSVSDLAVSLGNRRVLNNVTAAFQPGRVTAILGANGSGKSTLVKTLAGLLDPDDGQVKLGTRHIARIEPRERARMIGYLPQDATVHWNMLLHETDIAALYIADLAKALRADGWEIVSADTAYADPLKTAAPDVPSANGTLTELLAWEKGLPAPRWYERNNIALANRLFAERVLHEKAP